MKRTVPASHPDAQALRDWPLYGPRDPAIAEHVERLVCEQGRRLNDVEQIILAALQAELAK